MRRIFGALAGAAIVAGCGPNQGTVASAPAPAIASESVGAAPLINADEQKIATLLRAMSVERKVAQLIQPDIGSITVADVEKYRFGSVLNGGNSGPNNNDLAPVAEWLKLADAMWAASTKPLANGEPAIPTMWGTDAVHGHANIIGATIFPHNIGLGAAGDLNLIRKIGAATAVEVEATGIDWTFAPTIAVARDDRWGRTYESYSEDPQLVSAIGAAMVEGLQGKPGSDDYLGDGRVVSTAKHFFGDGGTEQGVDQGDVNGDLDELKAIHVTPYPAAIDAGVESIMASFNSINGRKMHGNKALLTDVLRGELGFKGLVVGDWNGHGQVAGCTNTDCPQALMAGLDIYMVPEDWKGLYETLVKQVNDGTVPMARLDEAVTRMLRLKQKIGFFDGEVRPSARPNGGKWNKVGSAEHRAIAREAVAKSLVLLKNDGTLPLKAGADILVAGTAANNIAQQSGGWTLTWQGGDELGNDKFPGATSIFAGLASAVTASGGSATLSENGDYETKPDVAIVVFGEEAYAEFAGDRKDLAFRDEEGLALLRRYDAAGIPAVALFLSGRPLWVNREMNVADAFVAAWLPGSEGAGVADVLTGAKPFEGELSFSWPATCEGSPLNSSEGALFGVGFGRSASDVSVTTALDESCGVLQDGAGAEWFASGRIAKDITASAGGIELVGLRGKAAGITALGLDRNAQEDARSITFAAGSSLTLTQPDDASSNGGFHITYSVDARPMAPVSLTIGQSVVDITQPMSVAEGKGWREMVLTNSCAPGLGKNITISSEGAFTLKIAKITREEMAEGTACSF